MGDVLSLVFSGAAVIAAIVSLWVASAANRTAKLHHFSGPEFHMHFEEDDEGIGDLLVLRNLGDTSLEMDISVYLDHRDDDRFSMGNSSPVWIFRRKLHPDLPHRWRHSFPVILEEMGYTQDATYIVRFVGRFWPTASGEQFSRSHYQEYLVTSSQSGRMYVERSDRDWYYADESPRVVLLREGIPEDLRKP